MKNKNDYLPYIKNLKDAKVLVLGDIMLDCFIYGEVTRISPEAPVPVVRKQREAFFLGGAGNVARNISAMGASAFIVGVVGDDYEAKKIRKELEDYNIKDYLIVGNLPTVSKTRIVAASQQIVRLDNEEITTLSPSVTKKIKENTLAILSQVNAVIISDYAKGVISSSLMHLVITEAKKRGVFVLVDPAIGNFSFYKGASALTPNLKEACEGISQNGQKIRDDISMGDGEALSKLGNLILDKLKLDSLLITLGENGIALFQKSSKENPIFIAPKKVKKVYDLAGAGDTVIAMLSLGLSSSLSMYDSCVLANYGAGIVVGKSGTATVSPKELKEAMKSKTL